MSFLTPTTTNPVYKVDFVRDTDGSIFDLLRKPWFVMRITNGALIALCKTRESAERAMAKRIAKDAAKAGERI